MLDALGGAGGLVTAAGFALLRAVGLGRDPRATRARHSGPAAQAPHVSPPAQSPGKGASAQRPGRPEPAAPTSRLGTTPAGGLGSGAGLSEGVALGATEPPRGAGSHGEAEDGPGLEGEPGVSEGGRRWPVRMAVPLSAVQDATVGELQRRLGAAWPQSVCCMQQGTASGSARWKGHLMGSLSDPPCGRCSMDQC